MGQEFSEAGGAGLEMRETKTLCTPNGWGPVQSEFGGLGWRRIYRLLPGCQGLHSYAVLTMCRALYTLQHGAVVSKPVAARWAQAALGERWAALIERASAWRPGAQSDHLDETLDFIRYTLERGQ